MHFFKNDYNMDHSTFLKGGRKSKGGWIKKGGNSFSQFINLLISQKWHLTWKGNC